MAQGRQARAPGPAGPARAVTVSVVPGTHHGQPGPRECYYLVMALMGPLKAPVPRIGMTHHNGATVGGGGGSLPRECKVDLLWPWASGWGGGGGGGDTGMLSAPLVLLKNPSISNFVVRSHTVLPVVFLGSP